MPEEEARRKSKRLRGLDANATISPYASLESLSSSPLRKRIRSLDPQHTGCVRGETIRRVMRERTSNEEEGNSIISGIEESESITFQIVDVTSSSSSSSSSSSTLLLSSESLIDAVRQSLVNPSVVVDGLSERVAMSSSATIAAAHSDSSICGICFDSIADADLHRFAGCPEDHTFCTECIRGWLNVRVKEGDVYFPCPLANMSRNADGRRSCKSTVSEEDFIACGCSEDIVAMFRRKRRLMSPEGTRLRDCPVCGTLVKTSMWSTRCNCQSCGHKFCKDHLDLCRGSSCLFYSWKNYCRTMDHVVSDRVVSATTKACPRCSAPTVRIDGCAHMTCTQCTIPRTKDLNFDEDESASDDEPPEIVDACHWCWLCNMQLDLSSVDFHYGPEGPCSGRQFDEVDGSTAYDEEPLNGSTLRGYISSFYNYISWAATAPSRPPNLFIGNNIITRIFDYYHIIVFLGVCFLAIIPALHSALLFGLTFLSVLVPISFVVFSFDPFVGGSEKRETRFKIVTRRIFTYACWDSRSRLLELIKKFVWKKPYPIDSHNNLSPTQAAEQLLIWSEWNIWRRELLAHRALGELSLVTYFLIIYVAWSCYCCIWCLLICAAATILSIIFVPFALIVASFCSSDITVALVISSWDVLVRISSSPLNAIRLLFVRFDDISLDGAWKAIILFLPVAIVSSVVLAIVELTALIMCVAVGSLALLIIIHALSSSLFGAFMTDITIIAVSWKLLVLGKYYVQTLSSKNDSIFGNTQNEVTYFSDDNSLISYGWMLDLERSTFSVVIITLLATHIFAIGIFLFWRSKPQYRIRIVVPGAQIEVGDRYY